VTIVTSLWKWRHKDVRSLKSTTVKRDKDIKKENKTIPEQGSASACLEAAARHKRQGHTHCLDVAERHNKRILQQLDGRHRRRCRYHRFYRSYVRSKLDFGSIASGSARALYLEILDCAECDHEGLQACLRAYHTSWIASLHVGAWGLPPKLGREKLVHQSRMKLKANQNTLLTAAYSLLIVKFWNRSLT
jgi:hypothetical protein